MSSHLVALFLFTVWHNCIVLKLLLCYFNLFILCPSMQIGDYPCFIFSAKLFAGLKLGKSCASIVIVVFLRILRAVFAALCLIIKLPNPRRYTFSFLLSRLSLIVPIKLSTTTATSFFVSLLIRLFH